MSERGYLAARVAKGLPRALKGIDEAGWGTLLRQADRKFIGRGVRPTRAEAYKIDRLNAHLNGKRVASEVRRTGTYTSGPFSAFAEGKINRASSKRYLR